jgi:hypothetical protein
MVREARDREAGAETERRFSSAQCQSSPVVPEGMRVVVVFMECVGLGVLRKKVSRDGF